MSEQLSMHSSLHVNTPIDTDYAAVCNYECSALLIRHTPSDAGALLIRQCSALLIRHTPSDGHGEGTMTSVGS